MCVDGTKLISPSLLPLITSLPFLPFPYSPGPTSLSPSPPPLSPSPPRSSPLPQKVRDCEAELSSVDLHQVTVSHKVMDFGRVCVNSGESILDSPLGGPSPQGVNRAVLCVSQKSVWTGKKNRESSPRPWPDIYIYS